MLDFFVRVDEMGWDGWCDFAWWRRACPILEAERDDGLVLRREGVEVKACDLGRDAVRRRGVLGRGAMRRGVVVVVRRHRRRLQASGRVPVVRVSVVVTREP